MNVPVCVGLPISPCKKEKELFKGFSCIGKRFVSF